MKLLTIKELNEGTYHDVDMGWTFSVPSIPAVLLTLLFVLINIDSVNGIKDVASLSIKATILSIVLFIVFAHICLYFHMCMNYIPPNED